MPVAPNRRQITISDEIELIARVDALVRATGRTRPEIYALAIRLLLADEDLLRPLLSKTTLSDEDLLRVLRSTTRE